MQGLFLWDAAFSWSPIVAVHLPSASPGFCERLKGFMLHNQPPSQWRGHGKLSYDRFQSWYFESAFACVCASKESSIYLHTFSLGSNEKANWPLGFLGKKEALSGKIPEKLIRIQNEQIFYCHYLNFPRKRDNLTLIAYQRNSGGLWQMSMWDTGWTLRYERNSGKQIILIIIINECICVK